MSVQFYVKQFRYVAIQLSVNTVLMSKKNSSISINSVKHKHAIQM